MDAINLNIDDYSILELFTLIGVNSHDNCDVFSLKTQVQNKYKQLRNIPGLNQDNKDALLQFIQDVYQRLLDHIKIKKENEILALEETEKIKTLRVQELNQHKPLDAIPTFPQKHVAGIINPLEKRTITKVINIDSLFRNNFYTTDSNSFDIMLPSPIKNVISMKVTCFELPKCVYKFNVLNKTNEFQIVVGSNHYRIEVREGNYTGIQLVNFLNNILPVAYGGVLNDISVAYDDKYERIVFSSINNFAFDLLFTVPEFPNRSITLNMGWIMGFRKELYQYTNDYISSPSMTQDVGFNAEACYTGGIFRYLFLAINEFKNNYNDAIVPVFTHNSTLTINNVISILRYDSTKDRIVSGCSHDMREYFGPVSIEKLRVNLYDEFGRLAHIGSVDFSFQLELECLYNL